MTEADQGRPTAAIVVTDVEGIVLAFSSAAESLTGHLSSSVVGSTLDAVIPPEKREQHWEGFRRAMASGVAHLEEESAVLPVLCGDGAVRHFAARLTLVRDAEGRAVGAAAVFSRQVADEASPSEPSPLSRPSRRDEPRRPC